MRGRLWHQHRPGGRLLAHQGLQPARLDQREVVVDADAQVPLGERRAPGAGPDELAVGDAFHFEHMQAAAAAQRHGVGQQALPRGDKTRQIPAPPGTADAVVDCLIDGTIPKSLANELCIISLVWIDPRCAKDPNLDKKDMYRTNYEATKLAIKRALNNEPSIDELIANRHKIKHDMDDWS